MKLILLHSCDTGEVFAVNPELILQIGDDTDDTEAHRPEDEVRIEHSEVRHSTEARCCLASRPFRVGDTIKFTGLTRLTGLNDQLTLVRARPTWGIAGHQVTLDDRDPKCLLITNFSTPFTQLPFGNETGVCFVPKFKALCGFLTCCRSGTEEEIEIHTKETLTEILEILKAAGIATVHDPTNQMGADTDTP